MLKQRIEADLKVTLKAGEATRTGVLRLLLAAIKNRELEKRAKGGGEALTDEEALQVLRGEDKKRRESIELFRRGGREELALREERERKVLSAYLPSLMPREEAEAAVAALLTRVKPADLPAAMKQAMGEFKGKAEGADIAAAVKRHFER